MKVDSDFNPCTSNDELLDLNGSQLTWRATTANLAGL